MSIEDLIITAFCLIEDELQQVTRGGSLRRGGFEPQLTDSEKLLMGSKDDLLPIKD